MLRSAAQLASEHNAELNVVHAIPVNEASTNPGVLEVRKYLSANAIQEWDRLKAESGVRAPFFVVCGSVGAGVRIAAHDRARM